MLKFVKGFIPIALLSLLLFTDSFAVIALANEEGINKITITVQAEISSDSGTGSLDVTSGGEGYQVESFQFTEGGKSFSAGDTPRVSVVLTADEGYRFVTGFPKSRVTVKGEGACTGVKRLNGGLSLEVTVRLEEVAGTAGRIDNVYWTDSPLGKARWDGAENVSAYELKLYYKNSVIKRVDKTSALSYDFYDYMTKAGTYYFEVRPIPRNSQEAKHMEPGEWVTSEELYLEPRKTAPVKNSSSQESGLHTPAQTGPGHESGGPAGESGPSSPVSQTGGWSLISKGWTYAGANGVNVSNTWQLIDGKWYYFDMAGIMQTGWLRWSGNQYFLSVNGDMATGWLQNNRDWYYMGADGAMQTGWTDVGGAWYYLGQDGVMLANTMIGDRYVGADGAWTLQ